MHVIKGLFVALLITTAIWMYHTFQYYRKRDDRLVAVRVIDKHQVKSQAFLMASLGLIFPLILLMFILYH